METTFETSLNRDEMERRRLEAVEDLLQGLTQSKVARKFGVSRTTASRWNRALQQKGADSLRKRRATGRPSRLSREQLQLIPDIFAQGAIVQGLGCIRLVAGRSHFAKPLNLRPFQGWVEPKCGNRALPLHPEPVHPHHDLFAALHSLLVGECGVLDLVLDVARLNGPQRAPH